MGKLEFLIINLVGLFIKMTCNNLVKTNKIEGFKLNYWLYQLLDESSYLIKSYELIMGNVDKLEPDVATTFLSYQIPSTN